MNIFSTKFDLNKIIELKNFFSDLNCHFESQNWAIFKAKNVNFVATLYESGKLVIQGKNIDSVVEEVNSIFDCIKNCNKVSNIVNSVMDSKPGCELQNCYIGVDESGKGDFFGPLVIAGVLVDKKLKEYFSHIGIKDSKKLSDVVIKQLALKIKKESIWSIVKIMPPKYNELYYKFKNLNKLLAWGHARVIENILEKCPECKWAMSDKFADESLILNALMEKGKEINLEQKIKGESFIAVAAASILARNQFVESMNNLSNSYKIEFPKGTNEKTVAIAKEFVLEYGKQRLNEVSKIHFKTFHNI